MSTSKPFEFHIQLEDLFIELDLPESVTTDDISALMAEHLSLDFSALLKKLHPLGVELEDVGIEYDWEISAAPL